MTINFRSAYRTFFVVIPETSVRACLTKLGMSTREKTTFALNMLQQMLQMSSELEVDCAWSSLILKTEKSLVTL